MLTWVLKYASTFWRLFKRFIFWKYLILRLLKPVISLKYLTFFNHRDRSIRVPNGHSFFFYSEIRNFTVEPKNPFVFLQWDTTLQFVLKRPFVFHSEIRNLELYTNGLSFFEYKYELFKVFKICFLTTNQKT